MIRISKPTIPKTTSGPANPNQPSFLMTLPPEIRNRIYELLFKRDEPVLLHDGEAYRGSLREKLREDALENFEHLQTPDSITASANALGFCYPVDRSTTKQQEYFSVITPSFYPEF
jgi:hypothetical protein